MLCTEGLFEHSDALMRLIRRCVGAESAPGRRWAGIAASAVISSDHGWSGDINFFPDSALSWTAGFLRNETAISGGRAAGSLCWGGLFNSHYWVDPANDLAVVFMSQSLPFVEPRVMSRLRQFESAVYARFGSDPAPRKR